jgi:hypothetical protein
MVAPLLKLASGPLGGIARGLGTPTTQLQDVAWREEACVVSPLGGDDGSSRAPTTFLEDTNGAPPPMRHAEDPGASTINKKTSMEGPLGGGAEDPGASTINVKNVDGGPFRRRCRRSSSTHHQHKKREWWAP